MRYWTIKFEFLYYGNPITDSARKMKMRCNKKNLSAKTSLNYSVDWEFGSLHKMVELQSNFSNFSIKKNQQFFNSSLKIGKNRQNRGDEA